MPSLLRNIRQSDPNFRPFPKSDISWDNTPVDSIDSNIFIV